MRLSNAFVIIPPVVGVIKEPLDCLTFELFLETCLLLDLLLAQQLLPSERWAQVNMECEDAKTALMRQAHGLYLGIDLNLVAEEGWAPVKVLGAEHDRFLVRTMLQDRHVKGLVQLEEH